MKEIVDILEKYSKDDYQLFYNTVDMLCKKGVNGEFYDYGVLADVISILSYCEKYIKSGTLHEKE